MDKFHSSNCSCTLKADRGFVWPNVFNQQMYWQSPKDLSGILHKLHNNAFEFADHISFLCGLLVIPPNKLSD